MALGGMRDENGWTAWEYARQICHELGRINEQLSGGDREPPVTRTRVPFVIATNASGNGQVDLAIGPGVQWNLLTCAFVCPFVTDPTGYVAFYRDIEEGTGLIKVVSAANVVDDAFNAEGHLIPEQSKLVVVARGMLANSFVSGNVTAKGILNAVPTETEAAGW